MRGRAAVAGPGGVHPSRLQLRWRAQPNGARDVRREARDYTFTRVFDDAATQAEGSESLGQGCEPSCAKVGPGSGAFSFHIWR